MNAPGQQPVDPKTASLVQSKAKSLIGTPTGKQLDAGALLDKAAKDAALAPGANPAKVVQLFKPPLKPGQPVQAMMKKK